MGGVSESALRFCVSAVDDDDFMEMSFVADVEVEVEGTACAGFCEVAGVGVSADADVDADAVAVDFGDAGNIFSRRAFRSTATSA